MSRPIYTSAPEDPVLDRLLEALPPDTPQDYRGILGYTPAEIGAGPAVEWSPFRPKPYPIIDSYEVAKAIEKTNATSLHRKDKK